MPALPAITWQYATAELIARFYASRPTPTMRAVVVCRDGEPVFIAGVYRRGALDIAFTDCAPDFASHRARFAVVRAIKAAMQFVTASARPVFAMRDRESDLLERLGFVLVDHENGEELYRWPNYSSSPPPTSRPRAAPTPPTPP